MPTASGRPHHCYSQSMNKLGGYIYYHIIKKSRLIVFVFVCVFRAHQTEDLTTSLTVIAHHHYIHGYFENEKLIFSLLLALEVCMLQCIYLFILVHVL